MKKRLFLFHASVNKISETAAIYWTGRLMLNCLSNDGCPPKLNFG